MNPRRSLAGPIVLLLIGGLFLWNNLRPEVPLWDLAAKWWPFLLILMGVVRLIEVLVVPERRAYRTVSGGEVVVIVFVCMAGWGLYEGRHIGIRFPSHSLEFFSEEHDFPVAAQAQAAGIKRIVFDNPRGHIKLTGAGAEEVRVTGRKMIRAYSRSDADNTNRRTPLELVREGDRLLVRVNHEQVPSKQRLSNDLEATVPRGVTVEARGKYGDYDFSDLTGDVDISSDNSGVRLARIGGAVRVNLRRSDIIRAVDVKGAVDLQGKGQDIELENIGGQVTVNGSYSGSIVFKNLARPVSFQSRTTELRAAAVPGRIGMTLSDFTATNVTGPIRFTTRARDIKIEDFTGALEVETERGDLELAPRAPMAKIDARSSAGDIQIVLPDKAAFRFQALAEQGRVVNEYGPAITKETAGHRAWLKGAVGSGPEVNLTTKRGTVTVRKAGDKPLKLEEGKF
jgi:DUF4097 and DUF4098 domain-containing protein YvlB